MWSKGQCWLIWIKEGMNLVEWECSVCDGSNSAIETSCFGLIFVRCLRAGHELQE